MNSPDVIGAKSLSLLALEELKEILSQVDSKQCETLSSHIHEAKRVFVTGCGRSMLIMRCFAMRLMQLGLTAYVAGETCTPAIRDGDLLIAGSGSGKTKLVINHMKKAKAMGARIACFTIYPEAEVSDYADVLIHIPGTTAKAAPAEGTKSCQIGGCCFEQSMLVLCDSIVSDYAVRYELDMSDEAIMYRHANLE